MLTTRNLGVGSHHFEAKSFPHHFFLYCSSRNSWLRRKVKWLARKWKYASWSIIFFNTPLLSNASVPDSYPVAIYVYLKWEEWEKIGVSLWRAGGMGSRADKGWASPAKNVWLVDARPLDIAKFKMAAIPSSFVYSSGKKINCRLIWVANAYTDFRRIAQTFYYPFSPLPMGFVPCDARVLAGLPDSALDLFKPSLFTITRDNNISDRSRVTRKNGLCWPLNAAEK